MQPIDLKEFLPCTTPMVWIESALQNIDLLLIDHAHCEKKAASTALNLLYKYPKNGALLRQMSRIAREELRHFEQVLSLMAKNNIAYKHLAPSRYAQGLRKHVRTSEPGREVDLYIIGAFIEARSCERFQALAPHLKEDLKTFYEKLFQSEERHFHIYLKLAIDAANEPLDERISFFQTIERDLILSPDSEFRFHSGVV